MPTCYELVLPVLRTRAVPEDRAHACFLAPRLAPCLPAVKLVLPVLRTRAVPEDRAHACLRRGSGLVARPSTTVLRPTVRAISTTGRRLTTRPCNLSRAEPSPRRCASRCRPRGTDWKMTRTPPRFSSQGLPDAGHRPPVVSVDTYRDDAARCGSFAVSIGPGAFSFPRGAPAGAPHAHRAPRTAIYAPKSPSTNAAHLTRLLDEDFLGSLRA